MVRGEKEEKMTSESPHKTQKDLPAARVESFIWLGECFLFNNKPKLHVPGEAGATVEPKVSPQITWD